MRWWCGPPSNHQYQVPTYLACIIDVTVLLLLPSSVVSSSSVCSRLSPGPPYDTIVTSLRRSLLCRIITFFCVIVDVPIAFIYIFVIIYPCFRPLSYIIIIVILQVLQYSVQIGRMMRPRGRCVRSVDELVHHGSTYIGPSQLYI